METSELLKKVRKIEIKTRGLSKQVFSGEYHSAFKGRGMAFSEVRNYMPGDEIRTIDWNVTARFNDPYVKVFEEERELTVMLMVDISASEMFGTGEVSKREFIAEVGAVLAFSATQNNDKIGAILFSDKIELFIPPKKGRKHILRIIRELIEFKPNSNHTNIGEVLQNFNNLIKKRSIAFLISDFMNKNFEDALKITSKKHDLIALRVVDNREKLMTDVGLSLFRDSETGKERWINTSSKRVREQFYQNALAIEHSTSQIFKKAKVDHVNLNIQDGYIKQLMNLFKKR
ncbi:MAG: DUF58 domain-containing protein [Bacteroidota bacterium]|nr:DUF58 domain-containing protein [Bacteroidota bacterium]MEC8005132.1 DUF58 domain-containing protein [Bacteroidota bacterium]MEC8407357.1 DUF58 domain-containing protein [Bacteroidota bacterium]MED5302144.1 DUF58 domain-containing protein [Bacteroidota bacterium]MED6302430.1 DUF58 domain-containing protein [Bacteroidota bacterium]